MVFQPEDNNEMDGIEVKSMPNFIPPEAAKEVQQKGEQPQSEPSAPEVASTPSVEQEPQVALPDADNSAQPRQEASGEDASHSTSAPNPEGVELQAGKPGDGMRLDKPTPEKAPLDEELDAERSNLSQVLSQAAAAVLAERQQVTATGQRPTPPAAAPQGPASMVQQPAQPAGAFEAIASGVNSVVSNTVGAAAGAVRGVVSGVASALTPADKGGSAAPTGAGSVLVLPRLSEYRVDQVERAAGAYEEAHQQFWQADKMPILRKEIEERARQSGISVEDVMNKMKPGGEFADLQAKFNTALSESPAAQDSKKAMNKALDGFVKQYGRAQEELLNPETDNSPHYKGLKSRLGQSLNRMSENAAGMPLSDGEDISHLDKLRDAMTKIAERLKEMVRDFVSAIRGGSKEASNAPSP